MSYNQYLDIASILLIVSAVFFIVLIILFVKLDIRGIIKSIRNMIKAIIIGIFIIAINSMSVSADLSNESVKNAREDLAYDDMLDDDLSEKMDLELICTKKIYNENASIKIKAENVIYGISKILIKVSYENPENDYVLTAIPIIEDEKIDFSEGFTVIETEDKLITAVEGNIELEKEGNDINVSVIVYDNEGNSKKKESVLTIDNTPPEIEMVCSHYNDSGYYNCNRRVCIYVKDANFIEKGCDIIINSIDGVIPDVKEIYSIEKEKYCIVYEFDEDGDYEITGSVMDNAHNISKIPSQRFIIDKTNPIFTYEYDKKCLNDKYCNENRTLNIYVTEKNFDPNEIIIKGTDSRDIVWQDDNDRHMAQILFSKEGEHKIEINGMDKAGNTFEAFNDYFVIDKTKPSIKIEDIENFSANNDVVSPKVFITDENFDRKGYEISILKEDESTFLYSDEVINRDGIIMYYQDFLREKTTDGIYKMIVESTDLAGNTSFLEYMFSVNRFGSSYMLGDSLKEIKNKYINMPVDISLSEINVDRINPKDMRAYLIKNGKNIILNPNEDFSVNAQAIGFKNCFTYEFPKELFNDDGIYTLSMYSLDEAGNVNQSMNDDNAGVISFGVDMTKPIFYAFNIEEGMNINGEKFDVIGNVKDNMELLDLKLKINGKNKDYILEDDTITFPLEKSDNAQTIAMSAVDKAGNTSQMVIKDITVKKEGVIPLNDNKVSIKEEPISIKMGVIVVTAVIIILLCAIFIRKKYCK